MFGVDVIEFGYHNLNVLGCASDADGNARPRAGAAVEDASFVNGESSRHESPTGSDWHEHVMATGGDECWEDHFAHPDSMGSGRPFDQLEREFIRDAPRTRIFIDGVQVTDFKRGFWRILKCFGWDLGARVLFMSTGDALAKSYERGKKAIEAQFMGANDDVLFIQDRSHQETHIDTKSCTVVLEKAFLLARLEPYCVHERWRLLKTYRVRDNVSVDAWTREWRYSGQHRNIGRVGSRPDFEPTCGDEATSEASDTGGESQHDDSDITGDAASETDSTTSIELDGHTGEDDDVDLTQKRTPLISMKHNDIVSEGDMDDLLDDSDATDRSSEAGSPLMDNRRKMSQRTTTPEPIVMFSDASTTTRHTTNTTSRSSSSFSHGGGWGDLDFSLRPDVSDLEVTAGFHARNIGGNQRGQPVQRPTSKMASSSLSSTTNTSKATRVGRLAGVWRSLLKS